MSDSSSALDLPMILKRSWGLRPVEQILNVTIHKACQRNRS